MSLEDASLIALVENLQRRAPDFIEDATGLLSTNMFAYCENDPVNGSDPNGEWIHIAIGSAMGAVTSIITGYASAKQAGKDYSLFMAVTDGLSGAASGALAQ